MSVDYYGEYAGIPVYLDVSMEKSKILIMRAADIKPNRNTRVAKPQIKGLLLDRVKAFIVHPEVANQIESMLIRKHYSLNI
jgi:hypothetical protein